MKLKSLILRNFKGVRDLELRPDGQDVSILGKNGVGKTTIADAFTWLLFDKDSRNQKQFEIKTLDSSNQPIHGLEHEVEGTLLLDNGKQTTLRKVFSEKWTKKRGAPKAVFTGHTTDYYVDDVPAKKGEYVARVAEIADEGTFRLLTDPQYFNTHFHWEKRRALLLEVCGDISDEEVIASNTELSKLPEILGDRKLEDHKKVIAGRRQEINKQLQAIPTRIDEVNRYLPDVSGVNPEEIKQKISEIKTIKKDKEAQISRIENGGEKAEKTKELREIESQLLELKSKHRSQYDTKIQAKQEQLNQARERYNDSKSNIMINERSLINNKNSIEILQSRMDDLRNQWNKTNNEEFQFEQSDTCPTCGQELPADQVAEAREKAQAEFNRTKAVNLEKITASGKELKTQANELQTETTEIEKRIKDAKDQLEKEENIVLGFQDEIETLHQKAGQYAESEQYQRLENIKKAVEDDITSLKNGRKDEIDRIKNSITPLENDIRLLESRLKDVDDAKKGQERIKELQDQEKKLAEEFEKLEGELYLADQFIKAKVDLLDEKINSRFKHARFKLFRENINGGIEDCCETLYGGVPYGSNLNTGAKCLVGVDIINTLADYYGFYPPVFLDNAESVTEPVKTRGQLIRLVADPDEETLRVEYPESEKEQREAV
ncbi:MAG: hypothetical protein FH756_01700 [Firmicutes bacterium]|nr:hypothetical protein [Bacillota bacterium]